MNPNLLVGDEAAADNMRLTDQDIDIFQGLDEATKTQEFREDFPTFLRNAPPKPLKWPSSKTFEPLNSSKDIIKSSRKSVAQGRARKTLPTSRGSQSEISFAGTSFQAARETVNQNYIEIWDRPIKHNLLKVKFLPLVRHVHLQKPGRVDKSIGKQGTELQLCTVFTCDPCQLTTIKRRVLNDRLHNSSHFDILTRNNLRPYCTFENFTDNANNFQQHIDSVMHNRKMKNCSSKKENTFQN